MKINTILWHSIVSQKNNKNSYKSSKETNFSPNIVSQLSDWNYRNCTSTVHTFQYENSKSTVMKRIRTKIEVEISGFFGRLDCVTWCFSGSDLLRMFCWGRQLRMHGIWKEYKQNQHTVRTLLHWFALQNFTGLHSSLLAVTWKSE